MNSYFLSHLLTVFFESISVEMQVENSPGCEKGVHGIVGLPMLLSPIIHPTYFCRLSALISFCTLVALLTLLVFWTLSILVDSVAG